MLVLSNGTALESTSVVVVGPIYDGGINVELGECGFVVQGVGYSIPIRRQYSSWPVDRRTPALTAVKQDRALIVNAMEPLGLGK